LIVAEMSEAVSATPGVVPETAPFISGTIGNAEM